MLTMVKPARESEGLMLVLLAGSLTFLVGVAEALVWAGPLSSIYVVYLFPAVGALYAAAGLIAWWRRPANRLGALMVCWCLADLTISVANTSVPALIAVGTITSTLPASMIIHLVHACPSGTVRGRTARITVAAAYFGGVVLQIPLWAFAPQPPPFDVLLISPHPSWVHTGKIVQDTVGVIVVLVSVWLLLQRLQQYDRMNRRILGPLFGYSIVAVLAFPLGGIVLEALGVGDNAITVEIALVAVVPVGFLAVVLRGGFARPGELTTFVESVTGSDGSDRHLSLALSEALGDPSATLLRWSGDGYVDDSDLPASLPGEDSNLAVVRIAASGRPVGAVIYDTELGADGATLSAVTRVVAVALEREQLADEVTASRRALQQASARLLAAADDERRRVARDLHDGLQGALVRLSAQAHHLAATEGEDAAVLARGLADGIDAAARSLRGLVNGVMPAPLVERGLAAAVHELTDDLPVPAAVTVTVAGLDERLPAATETTAYFVVAETLTNVVKHAGAARVTVQLSVEDRSLVMQVTDDGVGGAPADGGSGLAGLRDRLAVHGGTFEVASNMAGTRVRAVLPFG